MSANSRFAVAVHILSLLALEQKPANSKYIAGSVNTNPVVVRRILGTLHKAGLVNTQLGIDGGAELACAPEDITLLNVHRAIKQSDLFAMHASQPNPQCPVGRNIQAILTNVVEEAENAMEAVLAQVTIAQITENILKEENAIKE